MSDRLKDAARTLQGLDPMIRYRCLYRGKVIGQTGQTVDVRPYDPLLPDMAGIPLRHGVPGITVSVTPGCSVQVGWDDGRPDRPFAALWSSDASAVSITIDTPSLGLGSSATHAAVYGPELARALTTLAGSLGTAMTSLGQSVAAAACATFSSALPATLSPKVRVG